MQRKAEIAANVTLILTALIVGFNRTQELRPP